MGGARKAIEKSWLEDGDDGVTIIAGKGDFSEANGRDRSVICGEMRYKANVCV